MTAVSIPPGLEAQRRLGSDWAAWLDQLPGITSDVLDAWHLARDGDGTWSGHCSLVVPVLSAGERAVLKVGFDGDDESEFEHLALRAWAGRGAVRLLRADPRRRALLLERLGPDDLDAVDDVEACEIVGATYARLHVPALPQLRTVISYVERWLDALATLSRDAPIPRRLVEQALAVGKDLVSDPVSVGTLVHGDLHGGNVLAAPDGGWRVIDPKPMSGDPHYEPAPMLWNRFEEYAAAPTVRDGILRRFLTLVDVAGLDEDRARAWVLVREVLNAHWTIEDAVRGARALDADDREWITEAITIAKAVADPD